MEPKRYTTLLEFFRSNAFDIDTLYRKLTTGTTSFSEQLGGGRGKTLKIPRYYYFF
jgi:hypothetical protein